MGFVFVLPVSGGYMPAQLQALTTVLQAGARPVATLAASGGNCAAYAALIAGWEPTGIVPVMENICNSIQVKPRARFTPLNLALGFFSPSVGMYEEHGLDAFYDKNVTESMLRESEIWTATFNNQSNSTALFCSTSREKAILTPPSPAKLQFFHCEEPVYGLTVHESCMVGRASASVPLLMTDVFIRGAPHSDGGIHYASPFLVLASQIPAPHRHIVHIYGYNVDNVDVQRGTGTVFTEVQRHVGKLGEGRMLSERTHAIAIFESWCEGKTYDVVRRVNIGLQEIRAALVQSVAAVASYLFLYPHINRCTALYDCDIHEIKRVMSTTQNRFSFDLFLSVV